MPKNGAQRSAEVQPDLRGVRSCPHSDELARVPLQGRQQCELEGANLQIRFENANSIRIEFEFDISWCFARAPTPRSTPTGAYTFMPPAWI